ncbi:MAG: metabolite traffic protein EboE [Siphonobacter sp.]
MKTPLGHLSYCSNIHPGERWEDHFNALKTSVPPIRKALSPDEAFGIGLRVAGLASNDLLLERFLKPFQEWLQSENAYVFTMNGFPYGGFHNTRVKEDVHAPDWIQPERRDYTIRLFRILSQLLPEGLDGGVSTSPLTYRHWWPTEIARTEAYRGATYHMLEVVLELIEINQKTGQILHLDIEPEPDGLLENSEELIAWYTNQLIFEGVPYIAQKAGLTEQEAEAAIRTHIQVCYDVCHFAVEFEDPDTVLNRFEAEGIGIGKIQISSALKVDFQEQASEKLELLRRFDEPVYLHQVVAQTDMSLLKYPDLDAALWEAEPSGQWRVHYHVPLFVDQYGLLQSTRDAVVRVLNRQKIKPFTQHMEVETYTWSVLPSESQLLIEDSIIRELSWVKEQL